nr:DNA-directed DNA polymerase [Tanacetum cinerariifolium]
MRTRSQSHHNSPKQEALPIIVEPLQIKLPFLEDQFQEDPPPEVPMDDNRTMVELLQAPTEGYEDAIGQGRNYGPKGARFLIASRFPTPPLAFIVEPLRIKLPFLEDQFQEDPPPKVPMDDNRTMVELLQAPTEGYEDAIVILEIAANNFKLKHGTSSSTPAVSSEVAKLKDFVRALCLDKKNQSLAPVSSPTPAPVKVVEPIVLLAMVLTHTKIVPLLTEMFIETTSKRLADLGASINLMPFSMWEELLLPELIPTCMTLKLADRSVSKPIGIAKDVSFKVGVFYFPADFMVVDFEPDPRVPLILERNEAITYNLDQTVRYSANYNQMTANKIDVICEMYSQEVPGFSDTTVSGNPTPYDDLIVSTTSPTLTPFRDSDFLLFEEDDAFLCLEDDPDLPKINPFYDDPKGDIELKVCVAKTIKSFVDEPPEVELKELPPHLEYAFLEGDNKLPVIIAKELGGEEKSDLIKELKVCEAKTVKSSVDEPPEVELKELPPHLEYAFLEGDNKLPVIIAKELGGEEKSALIKDYKPMVQHQRRVNHKIHDVIKKEVEKLFDAGLIYPIFDSPWVSPVHCVPKKGAITVIENEENELIPTHLVTGWRVCIDYQKLNEATRKDHFPIPFMDQMLERLAGNEFYLKDM